MTATDQRQTVLIIGGPTASGKSSLALEIARQKNGVVINADSMQVYNGLPMLTAQPDAADLAVAPHVLYSALAPEETCTAVRWRHMALDAIVHCQTAGQLPIVVGGTGLYINTLLKGLSPIPDIPAAVREEMIARQKELGNPAFHAELNTKDPDTAQNLDPLNTQRVVRAREVLEHTGKGLAAWQKEPRIAPPEHLDFITVTLLPPREALYQKCNLRFAKMLRQGVLDEAKEFAAKHPGNCALTKALGYPELTAYLAGTLSLAQAEAKACQSTRHYAKRQITWFRHQIQADMTLESSKETAPVLAKL